MSQSTADFLQQYIFPLPSINEANQKFAETTGIQQFFESDEQLDELRAFFHQPEEHTPPKARKAFGDIQTPLPFTRRICQRLKKRGISPQILIEPSSGTGNFLIAALEYWPKLQQIHAVEVFGPYFWQSKFSLLDYFLDHPKAHRPSIHLYHKNIFEFDFHELPIEGKKLLILGNPPWVTSARMTRLNSQNMPEKSNFKKLKGLDALTGKGNFDIGEYIALSLLRVFSDHPADFAFLLKNSVVKNLVEGTRLERLKMSQMEMMRINAQAEFKAAVAASLFLCKLGKKQEDFCRESDFYEGLPGKIAMGWEGDKFVANVSDYRSLRRFDGRSPFVWRSGVKHDCAKVLELSMEAGTLVNKLGEKVEVEAGLLYPWLKGSDLKYAKLPTARKKFILTQTHTGQPTDYIEEEYPATYEYLKAHGKWFRKRKSSIFKNRPAYAIFGVGNYSLKPYKVAISALHKQPHFALLLPEDGKPSLLDDTCYFIGFDSLVTAAFIFLLLCHPSSQKFLAALSFTDSKRVYTKELLMRMDVWAIAKHIGWAGIEAQMDVLPQEIRAQLNEKKWEEMLELAE